MSLLLLRCYIVISCISGYFDIYFVFLCFLLLLAFVLSAVFLFVCVVFSVPSSLPRLTCPLLYCDWVWLADGKFFGRWGVEWVGAGSMPELHCAFHLRLRGGGCAHALAREGKRLAEISWQAEHRQWHKLAQEGKRLAGFPGRQQRSRGRHSTEDGTSWLKLRRKKDCRFPCMAAESAEISWQAQHRGWRKLAQEGRNCRADFVAGTAKRLKIAKSCFIFCFWAGFTLFSSEKLF